MPEWTQVVGVAQPTDPYYEWATETRFADLFANRSEKELEDPWIPVLIELAKNRTVAAFAAREWHHPLESSQDIAIPDVYRNLPRWAQKSRYCTAMARKSVLDKFNRDESLRHVINRIELGLPLKTDHKETKWQPVTQMQGTSGTVVTGIIDDGLAFANERFRRKATQSRVEYFWNQDGLPTTPPSGFLEGWELTRQAVGAALGIDDHLKNCTHRGIVDEDELYSVTHHVDFSRSIHKPVARRAGHGTHVMDVAAGYDLKDAPDNRPIICVQLPVATTADTSGASLGKYALDALHYIIARADSLTSKPPPIVVNLSYGVIAGPHNGSSIFEAAVDELIKLRSTQGKAPLSVVLPAGNSRLSRCHGQWAFKKQDAQKAFCWRILPDDLTPSFVEIWLPDLSGKFPKFQVTVTTPTGDAATVNPGEEWIWQDGTDVLCTVLYLTTAAPGRTRDMIFIAVAPTATLDPLRKVAPFGDWKVNLKKTEPGTALVDAWVQRDDTPYGYPQRGRQSRFDDDEALYRYWLRDGAGPEEELDNASSYIKRDGTLNALGTGCETIVVGGFRRKDWGPAKYSASGPVVHPPGRGGPSDNSPDAVAVSDDSHAHAGIIASGTRTSSKVVMNGTSVAAPQVTRWIATVIGKPGFSNRMALDALVKLGPPPPEWPGTRTENNRPAHAPTGLPTERVGSGRAEFPPGEFPSIVDRLIEP